LVKISVNRFVSRRVEKVRKEVEVSTQRLREKTLKHLEEIFTMAARVAGDEVKHQRIDGKMVRITLNQRRRWLLVAEQAAKTIKNVATNIDEQEIYIQLDKLQRLVDEATKLYSFSTSPQNYSARADNKPLKIEQASEKNHKRK
jgi:hypothetical protein